jgi:hypothetical protein
MTTVPSGQNQVQPFQQREQQTHARLTLPGGAVKKHRSWISLLGFCIAAVLASSLAFATIVAGASVALSSHRADEASGEGAREASPATPVARVGRSFTGMITDSHCGARHRNSHQTAAECARSCFHHGASNVLVDGERRYTLVSGEESLSKLAGERANVIGTVQGDAILVDSAAAIF